MFEPDSVDARILEQFDADLLAAEDEILGGDIMAGTQYKKSLLRLIIDLCERNNDEEQLAVYRDKYAKGFPVLFADTTKLSKFKHLQ